MANPAPPNQLSKPLFSESDGVSPALQAFLSQMTDTVNSHSGYNGPVAIANHLSLNGNRIMGVGAPESATDALSSGVAEGKYSVNALGPQLESNTKTGLKTMRRLNDVNQREQSSSHLNDLPSTNVNANNILPILSNSGSTITSVVPASLFTYADGSTIQLISRTDLFGLPGQFTITSISSSGTVITVVTSAPTGLTAGQAATISGVTPSSFNGTYTVTSASGSTLTFEGDLGTLTGSGGVVQTNSCYYYYVSKRDPTVHLAGPFPSDTMQNRLQVCHDGNQIIAVVVTTSSGGAVERSGGGGSPLTGNPAAGSLF